MTDKNEARRHPRVKPPAGTVVAWEAGILRTVSHLESLALGGFFIRTPQPPPVRSFLKLLLNAPVVGEVRAQAVVRRVAPGRGMGVEIVAMGQEDRARLSHFLRPLLGAECEASAGRFSMPGGEK
jgi:hypothetical protein